LKEFIKEKQASALPGSFTLERSGAERSKNHNIVTAVTPSCSVTTLHKVLVCFT